jgi:type II secretory pathway pseudopilin PulG
MPTSTVFPFSRARQRGQAILLSLILVLMIAAIGITRYAASGATINSQNIANNAEQMSMIKMALILYARNGRNPAPAACPSTTNARPGELPCPDLDGDGIEECLCTASQRVGRVPWKTLGIPEPKDAAGETFWYVLSASNRPWTSTGSPTAINSDTKGTLPVWKDDMVNNLTNEAIAVIIAPGAEIGTQSRRPNHNAACTLTGTTIAESWCANNYMEDTPGGGFNWKNNGPFVMTLSTQSTGTFNDQLMPVMMTDILPLIEQKVGSDLVTLFKQYKVAAGYYPWASNAWTGTSVASARYGNPPLVTATPTNWGSGGTPTVPVYLTNNNWWRVIYYAVGDRITASPSTFNVFNYNGGGNTSAIFITPGAAGSSRPSTSWADYVDDATNRDGDDTFATPASTAITKDHLYSIAYPYP